ncbi:MAG: hypothetical protein EVJ46_09345 [Candidatus Acididesulfobacter guangdongensis]|uniref:FAD-dependent protein C-terminal domain-containing protein n=1 Tax=Acididesulfobacter guangdongensis TaxID=2597225 RepID=A0A519BEN5_ACIG2|nr:MAG: hypothetical protein EVJ46_09345 [Candidatus Acididesulfobacter guangdongensis]
MIIVHDFKIEMSRLNKYGKTCTDNKNKVYNNNGSGNDTANGLELEEDIIRTAIIKRLSEYNASFINDYSDAFKIIIIKKSLDLRQKISKSVFLFALEIIESKPDAKELSIKGKKIGSIEDYILDLLFKSGIKARIASEKEKEIYYLNCLTLHEKKDDNKFNATNLSNEPALDSALPTDDMSLLESEAEYKRKHQHKSAFDTLKLNADNHNIYNISETEDDKTDIKPSSNKNLYKINQRKPNVVIIGMGPAGIFAAVELLKNGIKPVIIEKGKKVEDRQKDVEQFFNSALFNPQSNVVSGEGGAGTFSDGKLTTRKKDYYVGYCMNFLVQMGADKNILTANRPHVGSDILIEILKNIRKYLINNGAELRFEEELKEIIISDKNNSGGNNIVNKKSLYKFQNENENENQYEYEYTNLKLDGIITDKETINTDYLILAAGANNFKLYTMLFDKGVKMEQKPFAIGFRIEHKREFIDRILLRDNQKLSGLYYNLSSKKFGGYSFCMCPGGVVVGSSSEEGHLCINGMSYSGRDLENSNSAIVATVMPADLSKFYNCGLPDNTADNINDKDNRQNKENNGNKENKNSGSLAMLNFRRDLEKKAFIAGGDSFSAPFQYTAEYIEDISKNYNYKYENFFKNIKTCRTEYSSDIPVPSYRPAVTSYELFKLLPEFINIKLAGTLTEFNEKFHGFIGNSVLTGIEAGTSSPVRILRNKDFQSINVEGIYPCGEGSGYSGGIITSAMDGVKCAISIVEKITNK